MAIVRLRMNERDTKVNDLLGMFRLPHADYYSKGYQVKPNLVGGSAALNPNEAARLKAANELLKWSRPK
jgi:hypothetical protein